MYEQKFFPSGNAAAVHCKEEMADHFQEHQKEVYKKTLRDNVETLMSLDWYGKLHEAMQSDNILRKVRNRENLAFWMTLKPLMDGRPSISGMITVAVLEEWQKENYAKTLLQDILYAFAEQQAPGMEFLMNGVWLPRDSWQDRIKYFWSTYCFHYQGNRN